MSMNRLSARLSLTMFLAAFVGLILIPAEAPASKGRSAKVRGEVVAVNVEDSPHVIVLRSMTAKNQELIVGATVDPDVRITRGNQRITLDDIRVGESVDLVYVKTLEGLIARSIHVR